VAAVILVSVVVVNLVAIAADLQAWAARVGLLAGVDSRWASHRGLGRHRRTPRRALPSDGREYG